MDAFGKLGAVLIISGLVLFGAGVGLVILRATGDKRAPSSIVASWVIFGGLAVFVVGGLAALYSAGA